MLYDQKTVLTSRILFWIIYVVPKSGKRIFKRLLDGQMPVHEIVMPTNLHRASQDMGQGVSCAPQMSGRALDPCYISEADIIRRVILNRVEAESEF